MIRIDMIRQDTRHPDRRRRHQGRASCEVAGRRFETACRIWAAAEYEAERVSIFTLRTARTSARAA